MKTYDAFGVVETQYFAVAIEMLDRMCKVSNVELVNSEKYLGGRLVTLIVGGGISDVNAAVEEVRRLGEEQPSALKMALVIPNPHEEITRYIISPSKPKPRRKKRTKKQEMDVEQHTQEEELKEEEK